jgi:hypothetical protein
MEKGFSERMGLSQPKTLQLDGMDDELRNALWNGIHTIFDSERGELWADLARRLVHWLSVPVDDVLFLNNFESREWVRDRFFGLPLEQTI